MARAMAREVEFFYDLSSPWTRLAFANLPGLIARTGCTVTLRPVLVGGVFNAVNQAVYAAREATDNRRMAHSWKVLKDWAALAGVAMHFPSQWHPAKSVHAMRMACAASADPETLWRFTEAAFDAYFDRQENLDDPEVLVAAADAAGIDGSGLWAAARGDAAKAMLRANTDELIARGGFGSPTLFVGGGDMYFGNDQLPLVEAALQRIQA